MITINKIRNTDAVQEWLMKEEGSYEDSQRDSQHAYALLQKLLKGKESLNEKQLRTLIVSGQYQATAWNDDEIAGGARTKETISRVVRKLQDALKIISK